ncbi:MAG TPA: hypothetical protein VL137_14020 [Polyangiaceae bacterium]|nr:hypothetical protein [Polyangiaceae bacterium]
MVISIWNGSEGDAAQRASAVDAFVKAELAATTDATSRARLLFELGARAEAAGQLDAAGEHYRACVEANPAFQEPLERLLVLCERGVLPHSRGQWLDRLLALAQSPEEQQRAVIAKAAWLSEQNDAIGARALLSQWLTRNADDASAWLLLEAVAARLGDGGLRASALGERIRLARQPLVRAVLLGNLSQLQAEDQELAAAESSLEAALELRETPTYRALISLERLTRPAQGEHFVAALDARARLLARALEGAAEGEALGVTSAERTSENSAVASVLAAQAHLARGDLDRGRRLLDHALSLLPNDAVLLMLRLRLALSQGELDAALDLAKRRLAAGAGPAMGAALWVIVADCEALKGDALEAVSALQQALTCDPQCWTARAKLLGLLETQGAADQLANELEECAKLETTAAGKAHYHFAAAEILARKTGQLGAAREALNRAQSAGATALQVSRVARFLAALVNDRPGLEQSSSELRQRTSNEAEVGTLCLQVMRTCLLSANRPGTLDALAQLGEIPSGQDLANVIKAYSPNPLASDTAPSAVQALLDLAHNQHDPSWQRALEIAAARRAHLNQASDHAPLDHAIAILRTLHQDDPTDGLTASYLSELQRQTGDLAASADSLEAAAAAMTNPAQAARTYVQAGVQAWHNGAKQAACASFQRAQERGGDFPAAVLGWLQSSERDQPSALASAVDSDANDTYCRLQQFAWQLCVGKNAQKAADALHSFELSAPHSSQQHHTALLARALWSAPGAQDLPQAMAAIESFCGSSGALTSASAYLQLAASGATIAERTQAAQRWATAEPSLASACEWLATAHQGSDRLAESQALSLLGQLLSADEARPIFELAQSLAWWSGQPEVTPGDFLGADGFHHPNAEQRATALHADAVDAHDASIHHDLLGYNLLQAAQFSQAEASFRAAIELDTHDVSAWEGLRQIAVHTSNAALLAESLAALGDLTNDKLEAKQLWERTSVILLETLGDEERGRLALARAVEIDPSDAGNYQRLAALVSRKRDSGWLVRLIDARLAVIASPTEQAQLYWDKARALRRLGEFEGTLGVLQQLTALDPDHLGALALAGEIHLARGDFLLACEKLGALSQHPSARPRQRMLSGLCAADIADKQLGDKGQAIEILSKLCENAGADDSARERLVPLAAQEGRWQLCVEHLRVLMRTRADSEGRVAAARLSIAIWRDRLNDPAAALPAAALLFAERPTDAEGIDLLLARVLPEQENAALLLQARAALIAQLQQKPDQESALRLATVAQALGNEPLTQSALGAAIALGDVQPKVKAALTGLARQSRNVPNGALTARQLATLIDAQDRGPIAQLCALLAPGFASLFGPNLEQLQANAKDRLQAAQVKSQASEILIWSEAWGLPQIGVFSGGTPDNPIGATYGDEGPAFVIHSSLRAPLNLKQLQSIARYAFALKRGTLLLCQRSAEELAALLAGIANVAGSPWGHPHASSSEPQLRKLYDELPRKIRKQVAALTQQIATEQQDPLAWALAAERSLDRAALLATGDVSWVQTTILNATRSEFPAQARAIERRTALFAFAFSDEFINLRSELGMAPQ